MQSKPVYSNYFFAAENGKNKPIVRKKQLKIKTKYDFLQIKVTEIQCTPAYWDTVVPGHLPENLVPSHTNASLVPGRISLTRIPWPNLRGVLVSESAL